MSEPFLERLRQFTPNAGKLDRDALLFAAGRASARPNRGWVTLATLLTSTQVLSLVFLWPRNAQPADGVTVAIAPSHGAAAPVKPEVSRPSAGPGTWSTRHQLLYSETDNRTDDTISLIDSGPPLRASRPLPLSLLN